MRIGMCADLQFSEHARYSHELPSGLTSRLQDQLDCWDWIVKTCESCDALIVVGDVFDSRTAIDLPVLDVVCRAFHAAAEKIKLYIVIGNHDSYLKTPAINSTQVFQGCAELYEKPLLKPWAGLSAAMIPWMDDLDALAKAIDTVSTKADYLFTHVLVEGAVPHGKGLRFSALKHKKFKHVFLGDVHDPMELADNVHYIGSPMQIDYRDAGGTRGFYILDTKADELDYIENEKSPRFHLIDDGNLDDVRQGDFVRIRSDSAKDSLETERAAVKVGALVESEHVELDDTPPRLDVHTQDTHETALKKFLAYREVNGEDVERLTTLGLDILLEAGA